MPLLVKLLFGFDEGAELVAIADRVAERAQHLDDTRRRRRAVIADQGLLVREVDRGGTNARYLLERPLDTLAAE